VKLPVRGGSTERSDPPLASVRQSVHQRVGVPRPSPIEAAFLPYDRLLPRAAVVVTNGGWGGVLAAGVPLVVAGGTLDKPEIARRVIAAGDLLERLAPPAPRCSASPRPPPGASASGVTSCRPRWDPLDVSQSAQAEKSGALAMPPGDEVVERCRELTGRRGGFDLEWLITHGLPLGQIDEAVDLLTGEACKVLLVPSLS